MQSTSPWWSAACAVLQLQMLLVEYGCAPKGERGKGGTSSSWYYQSWRGRRSCIICRRHWSDYGQTYNIQKTAIMASRLFLFYLQFPRSLRHSFSAYEKESSRPARDNDMAQPNMIMLHDWLLACHSLRC